MAAAPMAQKQRTTFAVAAFPGQQGAQQGGDGRREVSS